MKEKLKGLMCLYCGQNVDFKNGQWVHENGYAGFYGCRKCFWFGSIAPTAEICPDCGSRLRFSHFAYPVLIEVEQKKRKQKMKLKVKGIRRDIDFTANGQWVYKDGNAYSYECANCGWLGTTAPAENICPNCGLKLILSHYAYPDLTDKEWGQL